MAKQTSDEAARWAFSQWSLRARAAAKFERAAEMLFDKDGLEMATHEKVAAYHASLFPPGEMVFDLTVGIGSDLIALAKRGPVKGFEIDPARAELARHNSGIEVQTSSYEGTTNYYFCDPARRSGGKRTINPEEFSPNPLKVMEDFPDAKLGVIKLSPMLPDEFLESLGGRLEFVSFGGECREALVLTGLAGRYAVQVETGEVLSSGDGFFPEVTEPNDYLYEADPAAIRAHCLDTLCEKNNLSALVAGYLTGEKEITSPWLKSYRVLGSGRFDMSSLKRMLRDLNAATPILKQRQANQDLDKLRKQLLLNGKRELAVAIYPVGKSLRQVVLEPVSSGAR